MIRVVIESPFAPSTFANGGEHEAYAREALRDSLDRGEAPWASHLLYTQVYDDTDPELRRRGIDAGLALSRDFDLTAVYADMGVSEGMQRGIRAARELGRPVQFRYLRRSPAGRTRRAVVA